MTTAAASGGSTGLPIGVVCAITFVSILGLALLVMFGSGLKDRERRKQARLDEVMRYRLLGAYAGVATAAPQARQQSSSTLSAQALHLVDRVLRARGRRRRVIGQLERSGLRMRPEEWAAIQGSVMALLAAVVVFVSGSMPAGLFGIALGWLGCRAFMNIRISRRAAAFEAALPDALQLVAGALRSGFALTQSIGAVAREGTEPVSGEFARVLQEVRLGAELEDALEGLAVRMQSYDLRLVIMAIRTAREIGGNLAEVLQNTVVTMRERVQLRGQVRVLSAEGRFSAKVLTGLPILMAVYLLTFKKGYLTPMYTSSIGIAILVAGSVLLIIGSVWLNRLTRIEV